MFELVLKVKEIWLIEMAPELADMYITREEVVKDKTGKVSRHHHTEGGWT